MVNICVGAVKSIYPHIMNCSFSEESLEKLQMQVCHSNTVSPFVVVWMWTHREVEVVLVVHFV